MSKDDIQNADAATASDNQIDRAIRRHDEMLIRWLTQKLGDSETARDIAQNTYLRVWRYSRTQTIDNPQALIFLTAAKLAANEFRARKRRRAVMPDLMNTTHDTPFEHIASQAPTPEAATATRQEIMASIKAINGLPPSTRRAFILSRFENKTYREIAAILEVSESSVEKYIITALKTLRNAVDEKGKPSRVIQLSNRRNHHDIK